MDEDESCVRGDGSGGKSQAIMANHEDVSGKNYPRLRVRFMGQSRLKNKVIHSLTDMHAHGQTQDW